MRVRVVGAMPSSGMGGRDRQDILSKDGEGMNWDCLIRRIWDVDMSIFPHLLHFIYGISDQLRTTHLTQTVSPTCHCFFLTFSNRQYYYFSIVGKICHDQKEDFVPLVPRGCWNCALDICMPHHAQSN